MDTNLKNNLNSEAKKATIAALAYTISIVGTLLLIFILVAFSTPTPPNKLIPEITFSTMGIESELKPDNSSLSEIPKTNFHKNSSIANKTITDNFEKLIVINTNSTNFKQSTSLTTVSNQQMLRTKFQNALKRGKEGSNRGNPNSKVIGPSDINTPISEGKQDGIYLKGRKLLKKPIQIENATEEGVVVVAITVDENGNVINAIPGQRGSTISSKILFEKARLSALEAKFDPSKDGTTEQMGSYTFVFTLE